MDSIKTPHTGYELADAKRQLILAALTELESKHNFRLVVERDNEPELDIIIKGKSFILTLR